MEPDARPGPPNARQAGLPVIEDRVFAPTPPNACVRDMPNLPVFDHGIFPPMTC